MNVRLLELREQRGVLRTRSAQQRDALAQHVSVLGPVFTVADTFRNGAQWVRRHPVFVGTFVVVCVILKPHRIWRVARWSCRIYALRNGWRALRARLLAVFLKA
ncbi:MAG: YqjK-like family protein [Zoogloeaceae bacterium]|jgi:hypothetical protein|nr:YqjK-like family protein [Zoogloeaceae bacterium]